MCAFISSMVIQGSECARYCVYFRRLAVVGMEGAADVPVWPVERGVPVGRGVSPDGYQVPEGSHGPPDGYGPLG